MEVLAFVLQVFEDLQKMLSITDNQQQNDSVHSKPVQTHQIFQMIHTSPLLKTVLGLFVALATVSMGMYAL